VEYAFAMRDELRAAALLLVLVFVGCQQKQAGTALYVAIDTNIPTPRLLDEIQLTAMRSGTVMMVTRQFDLSSSAVQRPILVRLDPPSTALDAPVTIEVSGLVGGAVNVRRTVQTRFDPGHVRVVTILLDNLCVARPCPGQTCSAGNCISPSVDPAAFPEWLGEDPQLIGPDGSLIDAALIDSGTRDGGVDAPLPGIDAPMDSGGSNVEVDAWLPPMPDSGPMDSGTQGPLDAWVPPMPDSGPPGPPPLTQWSRSFTIAINGAFVRETALDFPLLVRLRDGRGIDFSIADPDLNDLRFALEDGTLLAYEIDHRGFSDTLVWVKVPRIDPVSGARIVMYYGRPGTPAGQNAEGVWTNGFLAVYHMDNGRDSTRNHLDMVLTGTSLTEGALGGAQDFPPGAYGTLPASSALGRAQGWMASVRLSDGVGARAILSRSTATDYHQYLGVRDGFSVAMIKTTSVLESIVDPDLVGLNVYRQHDYVLESGGYFRLYQNGAESSNTSWNGTVAFSDQRLFLGGRCTGCTAASTAPNGEWLNGLVEEVRIHSTARSAGWLSTDDLNFRDELIMWP
jgi:Domain of unknown function (DUF2341)